MTDVEGRDGGGSASAAGMQRAQQRFRLRAYRAGRLMLTEQERRRDRGELRSTGRAT